MRARFISAHFLLSSSFVSDVPYDPDLYFIGEEITLAVRAFTSGYDLFHPSEAILWHEYTRDQRPKHWDDHNETLGVNLAWHERDKLSLDKVNNFLLLPKPGQFGCGTVRSFADYERYAGLSFERKMAHDYTWEGHEPPNPLYGCNWLEARRAASG